MLRTLRITVFAAGLAIVLAVGAYATARLAPASWVGRSVVAGQPPAASLDGQNLAELGIDGHFTLRDSAGASVTQDSFPGRWRLIYFGYTSCPDICPTTLQSIAAALVALGPQANRIVPLFITIDPARDLPDILARYTALFDGRIIALTGTQQQIAAAERAYRVYAARAPQPGGTGYAMDHTSFVYFCDPAGHLIGLYDRNVTAPILAAHLRKAIS